MNKVIILYWFNLKRMNKSVMFWVFVLAALVGIPFGLYQFTKDWNLQIYSQVAIDSSAEDIFNVGYFVLFITYFFTVFCGATITNSIANERISKVADLLTYHISPVKIVYAKMASLFTLLVEVAALVMMECIVLQRMKLIHLEKVSYFLNSIGIGSSEIIVICIMSVISIFIYMLLYAMVGVCITNQQQMQFAQLPVTILLIAAFVTSYVCLNNAGLMITRVMRYVPFVAPFIMGNEILNEAVSKGQLAVSVALILLLVAGCNYFIIRVLIPKRMIQK